MKTSYFIRPAVILWLGIGLLTAGAQNGQQPPPYTAPAPPMPSTSQAPGQKNVPAQQRPNESPDAPLPEPDKTSVNLRNLPPLVTQPGNPTQLSRQIESAESTTTRPQAEAPSKFNARW
jgi:outer membrane protein